MPELEHNPQLIGRLASMHEGNAAAHLKVAGAQHDADAAGRPEADWGPHMMLAASGFVIAASYWSLIQPDRALVLYRRAAAMYRAMGHSYWMVLALASASDDDLATMTPLTIETREPDAQSIAFAMVGNEIADVDGRGARTERLNAQWRHVGNIPVGRLGIPLDYYARCAEAMHMARQEQDIKRFSSEAANYIRRAAEAVRAASHDQYHWHDFSRRFCLPNRKRSV
jgi:hypothetical protein